MGAGVRAVVLGGWAALSLDSLPVGPLREYAAANVLFYAGSLAHEWLFPRCAAAVHHGGAGTVAAVLRCGIPNIVTPVFIDQFYWARRVQALRVGVGFSEPLRSIGAPADVTKTGPRPEQKAAPFVLIVGSPDLLVGDDGDGLACTVTYQARRAASASIEAELDALVGRIDDDYDGLS